MKKISIDQTKIFGCEEKGCKGDTPYKGWFCDIHSPGVCGKGDGCYCTRCYMKNIIEVHKRFEKLYGYVPGQPIEQSRVCIVCGHHGQLSKCLFHRFVYRKGWKQRLKGFCYNCYSENSFSKAMESLRLKQIGLANDQGVPKKKVRFNLRCNQV